MIGEVLGVWTAALFRVRIGGDVPTVAAGALWLLLLMALVLLGLAWVVYGVCWPVCWLAWWGCAAARRAWAWVWEADATSRVGRARDGVRRAWREAREGARLACLTGCDGIAWGLRDRRVRDGAWWVCAGVLAGLGLAQLHPLAVLCLVVAVGLGWCVVRWEGALSAAVRDPGGCWGRVRALWDGEGSQWSQACHTLGLEVISPAADGVIGAVRWLVRETRAA